MIDVIVCVKEPAINFVYCLRSIQMQKNVKNIIIITPKNSINITTTFLEFLGESLLHKQVLPTLIYEPEHFCLAYARKLGIEKTTSEYIAFVDSDVILAKNHLLQLLKKHKKLENNCNYSQNSKIVVEGVMFTYSNSPLSFRCTQKRMGNKFLKKGDRGFTHNTLTKRSTLINWKPRFGFALEDLMITNYVFKNKGMWYRYLQSAKTFHIEETSQFKRAAWFLPLLGFYMTEHIAKLLN